MKRQKIMVYKWQTELYSIHCVHKRNEIEKKKNKNLREGETEQANEREYTK